MLCDYGCGKEAKYQFKNGNWYCSKSVNSCTEIIKKFSRAKKEKTYEEIYGEEKAKRLRKQHKESMKGKNRYKKSEAHREKLSNSNKGQTPWWVLLNVEHPSKTEEARKKRSEYMLNGGAAHASKFIKNPSNPELKLREILKDLYPNFEYTYKVLDNKNYLLDISLTEHKIAIEYDGWYHFNIPGRKEYDEKRQKEIEQEGWKFIRYTIFDKFPTKEQVKEDINKLLEKE